MSTNQNEYIKYIGVEHMASPHTHSFKEFTCNGQFALSPELPDVKELISITAKATIDSAEVVETVGTPVLVPPAKGSYKALIYGHIKISFQYTAITSNHSLNSGNHTLYFCEYITLPDDTARNVHLFPRLSIEDLYSSIIAPKTLYHNVVVLLMAQLS